MLNTKLVAELIEKGDFSGVKEAMEKSMAEGSQTFEEDIARLVIDGASTSEEGLAQADSPTNLHVAPAEPRRAQAASRQRPRSEDGPGRRTHLHRHHARREVLNPGLPASRPFSDVPHAPARRTTHLAPLGHAPTTRAARILGERWRNWASRCETIESGPDDFPRDQPVGGAPSRPTPRQQDAGVRRPHRRGAHRPARAVDQRPLHAHAPRRQALRPRRLRHEDLGRRLRGGHRGIPAGHPEPKLTLALLLTSDEEGPGVDGTVIVCNALAARGEVSTTASSASPPRWSAAAT
jgi:hypothetical protein